MISYLTTDVDCQVCFNDLVQAVSTLSGVQHVEPHGSNGCIAVTHDIDEARLLETVANVGHTLDIAPNGEVVMGQAHGRALRVCEHHGDPATPS